MTINSLLIGFDVKLIRLTSCYNNFVIASTALSALNVAKAAKQPRTATAAVMLLLLLR